MATKKKWKKEVLKTKKGFPFYCTECDIFYRYNKLVSKPVGIYQVLTCPECGEMVEDIKRK